MGVTKGTRKGLGLQKKFTTAAATAVAGGGTASEKVESSERSTQYTQREKQKDIKKNHERDETYEMLRVQ